MRFIMKMKQDNDVTNHTGVVYTKNKFKLLWFIELGVLYDENQTGQWHDRSYTGVLRRKSDIELLWLIELGANYDEIYIGQHHD